MWVLVLEHKNKCELIKIAHQLINSKEYQLNRKYMVRFHSTYKLAARLLVICWKITFVFTSIMVLIFSTMAYIDSQLNFSIIMKPIWLVIVIMSLYNTVSHLFIFGVYTYLVTLYIKYRFQQVNDSIEIYLKRGNVF